MVLRLDHVACHGQCGCGLCNRAGKAYGVAIIPLTSDDVFERVYGPSVEAAVHNARLAREGMGKIVVELETKGDVPMNDYDNSPKALFILPDGNVYPDTMICCGTLPAELGGKPCPYSRAGRAPDPLPLDPDAPNYSIDKGQPGDLCPPCAKQQLAHLGHWQGHGGKHYPEALLPLRLFKCYQWFWLVVPGLYDAEPARITLDSASSACP